MCSFLFSASSGPAESAKSKKKKQKRAQQELTINDVPAVHQKRVMEIINESQGKKNKKGSLEKSTLQLSETVKGLPSKSEQSVSGKSGVKPKPSGEKVLKNTSKGNPSGKTHKNTVKGAEGNVKVTVAVPDASQAKSVIFKDGKLMNGVSEPRQVKESGKVKKCEVTVSAAPREGRSGTSRDVRPEGRAPAPCDVTVSPAGGTGDGRPVYRLSEVLNCIAPTTPPPREELKLENLRLPPGITITKVRIVIPYTILAVLLDAPYLLLLFPSLESHVRKFLVIALVTLQMGISHSHSKWNVTLQK